jgi:hypothetical protein
MGLTSFLAEPGRFQPIEDLRQEFPGVGFTGSDTFRLEEGNLLITDPVYLADVYNAKEDPVAQHVRCHGVIVTSFGGDASCAVWWKDPILLLPLSVHPPRRPHVFKGAKKLAPRVACDSGSFLFLPLHSELPRTVKLAVDTVLAQENGASVRLPPGIYRVFYEQHDVPEGSHPSFCRHVVAQRGEW